MIITIGKCSRSYLFIIGSAFFKFLSVFLVEKNNNNGSADLFGFYPILNKFNFTQSIIIYFGYIIFGIIFFFFKTIKKEEQNKMNVKDIFIYNDPIEIQEKKLYKNLILLSLTFVLYTEIKKVLYIEGFQFFNF